MWLQQHPLRPPQLECLVLDDLKLAGDVDLEWRRIAVTTGHVGIPNAFQMFLGLKLVLESRRRGGSPIKRLVLRERTARYDQEVLAALRQYGPEVLVGPGPL